MALKQLTQLAEDLEKKMFSVDHITQGNVDLLVEVEEGMRVLKEALTKLSKQDLQNLAPTIDRLIALIRSRYDVLEKEYEQAKTVLRQKSSHLSASNAYTKRH
ncbi:MAG TPA: hypothetical protein VI959_00215 [Alphaproteobacteria bacterium]|nr:hypothetical protein [Alphaproteobacteria bacterium]